MTEFNVGDRIRTKVRMGNIPKETNGVVSYVYPDGDLAIHFSGSNSLTMYLPSECERVSSTIDLTDLNDESIQKVKEFADSLRRQAPPTEDDKYIWLIEGDVLDLGDRVEALGIRDVDGDYRYLDQDSAYVPYISSDQITKWRPAQVS